MKWFGNDIVRRSAIVFGFVAAISACSGGGTSNQPLTPDAFGAKYRFADNELSGWTQTTDPNDPYPYGVYTDATLEQRIDGGNMAYTSKGMKLAMYQDLMGPKGSLCSIVAMDFVTEANAQAMFAYQKGLVVGADAVAPYDLATAFSTRGITSTHAYAHVRASYFEVVVDGVGDAAAANQAASQFLQVLETKTQ